MSAKQLKKQKKETHRKLQMKFIREMDWYTPFVNATCGFKPDYTTTTSKMLIEGTCVEFPSWKAFVLPANLERKRRENYKDVLNKQKLMQTLSVLPISIVKVDHNTHTIELSRIRFTDEEQQKYLGQLKQLIDIRNTLSKVDLSLDQLSELFETLFKYSKNFNITPYKCINDCIENYDEHATNKDSFSKVFELNDKQLAQKLYNIFLKERKLQLCELEFKYPVIHEYASMIINDALTFVNNIKKLDGDSGFKCVYGYLFVVKSKLQKRATIFLENCKQLFINKIEELKNQNTYKIINNNIDSVNNNTDSINTLEEQPNCNLMLIGHVAAGKTTVTKVLTGKTTLASSFEKETLRTRELGYATFKTYNDDNTLNKHINIMDCPGHASFMKNAISGTKGIDCILVIISAKEGVQPQTIQHLLMCYSAGFTDSSRILILLNKSELLNKNELKKQTHKVRKDLRGTIAIDSLMYPVSAINFIGFESVIDWINKIHIPKKSYDNVVFPVIRSFDPNKTCKKIIGGVLGIMGMSGNVNIGDKIYLNPQNIITRVVSVRSENQDLKSARAGGCVAIGTTLDPVFVRVNKCVGSIVTTEPCDNIDIITICEIQLLGDFKFKKAMAVGSHVKIQLMTSLINATIDKTSKSSRKIKVKLSMACPIIYSTQRVSIYNEKYKLYGFGNVKFENRKNKILYDELICENSNNSTCNNFITEQYAFDIFNKYKFEKKHTNISIPPPIATADVTKVYYKNAKEAVDAVHRTMEDLRHFIAEDKSTSVFIVGEGITIMRKRERNPCKYIENIMTNYMMKQIKCNECGGFNTRLISKGIINCEDCNAQGIILN
jgi:translation initiation factor 2 subunit 3